VKQPLKLSCEPLTLDLRTTFRIAHGSSDHRYNVISHLYDPGSDLTGLGEGAAVSYHGESQGGIMEYIQAVAGVMGDDPFLIEDILNRLPPGSQAARAAIDIALHDLWGKRLDQPLYRLLGLNPAAAPQTSFTIAIDEPDLMAERASASGLPVIKIKLGGPKDIECVAAIRSATQAKLTVDANAGWSREQAQWIIPRLLDYDLELIEQPLPVGDLDGLRQLRQFLKTQKIDTPIFADESVKTAKDVAAHAGVVDGVVIKLMKTGGIREALRAVHTAHAFGMQTMIGCMVESCIGVSAAVHISPLFDYADLDGPLLIKNDPFRGVQYDGCRLLIPARPGIGVLQPDEISQ
jgi:L-alanine-DL-glutamate epimerase-like enolase superfamily enzyme